MSRIEDNEAERQERVKEEQKRLEKRTDDKRLDESRQFKTIMERNQTVKSEAQHHEQQHQSEQGDAHRQLAARRGIADNSVAGERIQRNANLNDAARKRLLNSQGDKGVKQPGVKQTPSHTSGETRAVTRGNKQQSGSQKRQESRKPGDTKEAEAQRTAATFAAVNQAVMGIDDIGARAGSLGGPIMQPSLREIIDKIVAGVRQGIDATKGFETIQVDLHDEVLGGARLVFQNNPAGIDLSMTTGDRDVAKLLSSGQNANELSQALKKANINLLAFKVNDQRIM